MSINRWMDNEDMIYIHTGLLLCHKKEWNNAIFSNMDRPTFIPSEVRERQIYDTTFMLNLKKWCRWTYLQNRFRDIEN